MSSAEKSKVGNEKYALLMLLLSGVGVTESENDTGGLRSRGSGGDQPGLARW